MYNSQYLITLNQVLLKIADFLINIHSSTEMDIEPGYIPFISDSKNKLSDINIEGFAEFPNIDLNSEDPVFEAKTDYQKFYSIYSIDNNLVFLIYNQQNINEIQQYAILDKTFKNWKIYSEKGLNGKLNPLQYPMGPIIMQYLTVQSEAVMIHASCVSTGNEGRIFTGFSGAGKSTISQIWANEGNQVINDDRIIIRKIENEYFAYNTPMYYADSPKKTQLNKVFIISHSPHNELKKLNGALAITNVLAFCIQNNFNKTFISDNLNFIADMLAKVNVYKLGFVPDKNIINYILENE